MLKGNQSFMAKGVSIWAVKDVGGYYINPYYGHVWLFEVSQSCKGESLGATYIQEQLLDTHPISLRRPTQEVSTRIHASL
jgi:hypothetical protein